MGRPSRLVRLFDRVATYVPSLDGFCFEAVNRYLVLFVHVLPVQDVTKQMVELSKTCAGTETAQKRAIGAMRCNASHSSAVPALLCSPLAIIKLVKHVRRFCG